MPYSKHYKGSNNNEDCVIHGESVPVWQKCRYPTNTELTSFLEEHKMSSYRLGSYIHPVEQDYLRNISERLEKVTDDLANILSDFRNTRFSKNYTTPTFYDNLRAYQRGGLRRALASCPRHADTNCYDKMICPLAASTGLVDSSCYNETCESDSCIRLCSSQDSDWYIKPAHLLKSAIEFKHPHSCSISPINRPVGQTGAALAALKQEKEDCDLVSTLKAVETPFEFKLAKLRMEALRLEEERFLEIKRRQELEKVRGPKPKWYMLRTPEFTYELCKNNQLIKNSKYWDELWLYQQKLMQASRDFERAFTTSQLLV